MEPSAVVQVACRPPVPPVNLHVMEGLNVTVQKVVTVLAIHGPGLMLPADHTTVVHFLLQRMEPCCFPVTESMAQAVQLSAHSATVYKDLLNSPVFS